MTPVTQRMEGLQDSSNAGSVKNTEDGDDDRQMDRRGFQREQFDVFKHNFREAYDEHYGAEELESSIKCVELKRAVINLVRRLRRAEQTLRNRSNMDESALERICTTRDALATLLVKPTSAATTDFTPTNIALPRFNRDDIELLLGEDPQTTSGEQGAGRVHQPRIADYKRPEDACRWIEESNRTFQSRVEALLTEGEDALLQSGLREESLAVLFSVDSSQ